MESNTQPVVVNPEQLFNPAGLHTCPNCDNAYHLSLIDQGRDWNDFGQRYCPFCGCMEPETP